MKYHSTSMFMAKLIIFNENFHIDKNCVLYVYDWHVTFNNKFNEKLVCGLYFCMAWHACGGLYFTCTV